jgi:hypothetical protein
MAQVQDDPSRHDYNIDAWVDKVIVAAQNQATFTKTIHQMWACGSDFEYQNADHWSVLCGLASLPPCCPYLGVRLAAVSLCVKSYKSVLSRC